MLEGGQHQGEDHLGQEGQQGGPGYISIIISTQYLQVRLQLLLFTDLLLVCKKKR